MDLGFAHLKAQRKKDPIRNENLRRKETSKPDSLLLMSMRGCQLSLSLFRKRARLAGLEQSLFGFPLHKLLLIGRFQL
jgi:hypothetical protein